MTTYRVCITRRLEPSVTEHDVLIVRAESKDAAYVEAYRRLYETNWVIGPIVREEPKSWARRGDRG